MRCTRFRVRACCSSARRALTSTRATALSSVRPLVPRPSLRTHCHLAALAALVRASVLTLADCPALGSLVPRLESQRLLGDDELRRAAAELVHALLECAVPESLARADVAALRRVLDAWLTAPLVTEAVLHVAARALGALLAHIPDTDSADTLITHWCSYALPSSRLLYTSERAFVAASLTPRSPPPQPSALCLRLLRSRSRPPPLRRPRRRALRCCSISRALLSCVLSVRHT